jgi:hypothetical protein
MARQIVVDIIGDSSKYTRATKDAMASTSKFLKPLDDLVKRGGIAGSIMQGVGQSIGQMLNPMSIATRGFDMMADGAGKVASSMVNLGKAYRDDRLEQDMLNNTLMRNVDGWRQYTGVIDDAIQSGQRLAFTDSDIRESLGRLVTATKDVSSAIKYNRLAMDIARQRNIKLSEASKAVTKAAQGQVRALKGLGYQIDTTASATENLDSVQRQAAGSAEVWAKSPSGKLAARLIEITEKAEASGKSFEYLSQTQNDLALTTLDVGVTLTTYLGIMADFLGVSKNVTDTTIAQSQEMANLGRRLQEIGWSYRKNAIVAAKNYGEIAQAHDWTLGHMTQTMDEFLSPWRAQWKQAAEWAKDPFRPAKFENWLEARTREATRKAKQAAEDGRPGVAARWRAIARAMKSPVITAVGEIKTSIAEVIRAMKVIAALDAKLGGYRRNGSTGKNPDAQVGDTGGVGDYKPTSATTSRVSSARRASSGTTINVTINAGIGTDPAELGRHVTRALKAYGQGGGIPSMKSAIGVG